MERLLDNAEEFMTAALAEAQASLSEGGIPVGAVLVREGMIIGRGRNRRVQNNDPTAHAEIECLRNAGRVGSYKNDILYSTTMPCHLCAGAIVQFGIQYVVVGERRNYTGARNYLKDHWVQVERMDDEGCVEILERFIAQHPHLWNEDIGED